MSAAGPGEVLVSGTLRELVVGSDLDFNDRGLHQLKGVPGEWRLWALGRDTAGADQSAATSVAGVPEPPGARPSLPLPDKPSIAVLPFANLSGDPDQDYFADGIVEDIITGLSRIKWIFVIARNSSFTYKGKAIDIKHVGRELGVRYVLEGSVRRSLNRVRIAAQLIDASSGTHIWADRYDRALDDIFAVQDEIAISVVGVIEPTLRQAEIQRAKRKRPDSLDATIFTFARCLLPSPRCPRTRTGRWLYSSERSSWSRTMPRPTRSSPGATSSDIYAVVSTRTRREPHCATLAGPLPWVATTPRRSRSLALSLR